MKAKAMLYDAKSGLLHATELNKNKTSISKAERLISKIKSSINDL